MHLPLVDYHCHLDLYPNFEELIRICEQQQIHTLGVTTTPLAWSRNFELTKGLSFVRSALGLHPQLVSERFNEISIFERFFEEAQFIGEVGLDAGPAYYRTLDIQLKVFSRIVQLCAEHGGKVLTIHSVRSASKVLDLIEQSKAHINNRVILHWYSDSIANARRAVDMGCYFSVNVPMLQAKSATGLLSVIPINRILTETDGPFTSISNRVQHPTDIAKCLEMLADCMRIPLAETASLVLENLGSLVIQQ